MTLNRFRMKIDYYLYDKKNNKKIYFDTQSVNDKVILTIDLENIEGIDLNNNYYFDFEFTDIYKTDTDGKVVTIDDSYSFDYSDRKEYLYYEINKSYRSNFLGLVEKIDEKNPPDDRSECYSESLFGAVHCKKYYNLKKLYYDINYDFFNKTYTFENILEKSRKDYILNFTIKNQNSIIHYEEKNKIENNTEVEK